jgi:hypothetical protein
LGTAINFALVKHMIDTKKKENFIKLLIQMGRGPPHLKGLIQFIIIKDFFSFDF